MSIDEIDREMYRLESQLAKAEAAGDTVKENLFLSRLATLELSMNRAQFDERAQFRAENA